MKGCENCRFRALTEEQEPCNKCSCETVPTKWIGPTNADAIRAMDDADLANFLNCMQANAYIRGSFGADINAYPSTNAAWRDWLKQGEAGKSYTPGSAR